MIFLTVLTAWAGDCPPVVELPAAVASARQWPDRLALATCTERDGAEQPKADEVARLLGLLEAHHPEIERGPLRSLVEAAGSGNKGWVEQAMRSARLGRSLPERTDGNDWHEAIPVPVPNGTVISFDGGMDAELAEAAKAVATRVGWTVGTSEGPPLALALGADPEPAIWGKHLGYAIEVTGSAGEHSVNVDGFAVGPMAEDTRQEMLQAAVAQVLADQALVAALAPGVEAGPSPVTGALRRTTDTEVCLFRRPDNAGLPVKLQVGDRHEVPVATASYGCMKVPTA